MSKNYESPVKLVDMQYVLEAFEKKMEEMQTERWLTDEECVEELGGNMTLKSFQTHHKPKIKRNRIGSRNIRLSDLRRYQEEGLK